MTNVYLYPNQLILFHEDTVTRTTALNYVEEMEKAKTPFITVEKIDDEKYNVIGGFKYINGIRLLRKNIKLYCTVVPTFNNEVTRKFATLQRCLVNNEKLVYKEILVHELTKFYKLNENEISAELGHDSTKVKRYMYNQIIPKTYINDAEQKGVKPFIQAIYLRNSLDPFEKRLLTELSLYPPEDLRFRPKHLGLYKKYRKKYSLFSDFSAAKEQILKAIHPEEYIEKHWENTPHPAMDHLFNNDHIEEQPFH